MATTLIICMTLEASFKAPASTGVKSRVAPEPLAWGLAFLRPPERVPEVPVVRLEHLLQLEKIQEVLPSRRVEAHFR